MGPASRCSCPGRSEAATPPRRNPAAYLAAERSRGRSMSISIAVTGSPSRPALRPVAQGLAVVAVVFAALSQHTALLSGAGRLGALSPGLVGAAVVAEVVSFAALAELQRRLLGA